jgi:acyl carrier protein
MPGQAIEDRVLAIIAAQARMDVAQIGLDMTPGELGLESLGLVEVIFAIEEEFDIAVPFNANTVGEGQFDVSTVGSVVAAVRGLVQAK